MAADINLPPDLAITRENYLRRNLTRPLTDDPIGGHSASITRRSNSAKASRAIEPTPDPYDRHNRNPATAMLDVATTDRECRKRLAAKRAAEAAQCPVDESQPPSDSVTPQEPENAA